MPRTPRRPRSGPRFAGPTPDNSNSVGGDQLAFRRRLRNAFPAFLRARSGALAPCPRSGASRQSSGARWTRLPPCLLARASVAARGLVPAFSHLHPPQTPAPSAPPPPAAPLLHEEAPPRALRAGQAGPRAPHEGAGAAPPLGGVRAAGAAAGAPPGPAPAPRGRAAPAVGRHRPAAAGLAAAAGAARPADPERARPHPPARAVVRASRVLPSEPRA